MLTIFLIALVVYIALGIIGFVVHGLIWLLVIAAILFVAHLVLMGYRGGRTRGRTRV